MVYYLKIAEVIIRVNCPDNLYLIDDWKRFFEEEWGKPWLVGRGAADIVIDLIGQRVLGGKVVAKSLVKTVELPEIAEGRIIFNHWLHPSILVFYLRQLMMEVLGKKEKIGLHASGVVVGDKAWLIMGPSGSGKSTALGQLVGRYPAIAEDVVILEMREERVRCWPTPLNLKVNLAVENKAYLIAGVLTIKKNGKPEVRRLGEVDGLVFLLDQMRNYADGQRVGRLAMPIFKRLSDKVFEVQYGLNDSLPEVMKKLWQ